MSSAAFVTESFSGPEVAIPVANPKPPAPPTNPADHAFSLSEILKTSPDPEQNLLGNRFLCRTGGMLFVGPSGVGKSSASMVMDLSWSCGREAFGIIPARPLRVLCIQAENDPGDLHEMAAGTVEALDLDNNERELAEAHFRIIRHQTTVGQVFLAWLAVQIEKHRPDVVRLDPLLAYLGEDPSDTKPLALFCRSGLNPLLMQHNCAAILNHHTPKTNYRDTSEWKPADWMYAGGGAADLTNWARAILVVDPTTDPGVFKFIGAKRGRRIGWQDEKGLACQERFFSHSSEHGKIEWSETPRDVSEGLAPRKAKVAQLTPVQFLDLLPPCTTENPAACMITMQELEMRAQAKRFPKNGLAGLRDMLDREGKIYVHRTGGGRAHAIRVGRPEIRHLINGQNGQEEAA